MEDGGDEEGGNDGDGDVDEMAIVTVENNGGDNDGNDDNFSRISCE